MEITLENIFLIIVYAACAYVLYKFVSSPFRQTESNEEVDLTNFVKKVQQEFDFHWKTYEMSPHMEDSVEAYVCGKTGYVFAKIVPNKPFFTVHIKGDRLGDYTSQYAAKQAVDLHINTLSMLKRISVK